MHYVDEGPSDGQVVLLLHGQPTWSYLFRKMIPRLAGAGLRVIAPDMIGMGRSDKPVQIGDYRYLQHVAWVEEFIDTMALRDMTVFVQDWGSLIGLRVVGNQPDRFARIVVANGRLPVVPEGFQPITLPPSLEPDDDMVLPFTDPTVRDNPWPVNFAKWAAYALVGTRFRPSEVLAHGTVVDLTDDELAAYDAPFPSRIYMAGVRAFPSLINTVGEAPTNERASEVLDAFDRPVLTLFGRRDEGMGTDAVQSLIHDRVVGRPANRTTHTTTPATSSKKTKATTSPAASPTSLPRRPGDATFTGRASSTRARSGRRASVAGEGRQALLARLLVGCEMSKSTEGELEPGPEPVQRGVPRTEFPHRGHDGLHAPLLVRVLVGLEGDVVTEPFRLLVRVGMTSHVDEQGGVVDGGTRVVVQTDRSAMRSAIRHWRSTCSIGWPNPRSIPARARRLTQRAASPTGLPLWSVRATCSGPGWGFWACPETVEGR